MYPVAVTILGTSCSLCGTSISRTLLFAASTTAAARGPSLQLALSVLFLGGLSMALGQSVVLFANRVSPRRFVLSLVTSALVFVLGAVFWAASIWLVAWLVFETESACSEVLRLVAIGYLPFLLGFLILLPYLGNVIKHLLHLATLLAVLVLVGDAYRFSFWQALLCVLLGWGILQLTQLVLPGPYERFEAWLWRSSTGTPRPVEAVELAETLAEQERAQALSAGQDEEEKP